MLYVEDNPDDALLLQRALRKKGFVYPLLVVEHGAKAVDYLSGTGIYSNRQKYPLPKLIVVDLTLPIMDGFSFLRWLRTESATKKMPAVVLSGARETTHAKLAFQNGCDAFFPKTPDTAHLEEIVQLLHDNWLEKSDSA
ncbi:MAG: response regulator [Verrucomicrobiota bacterium]